jgi:transposase
MRPLAITGAGSAAAGLQKEMRRSAESRYDHRLHGVLLVARGMTCPEAGRLLGDAPRTVEYWVRKFEKDGLEGLLEGRRPGRSGRLSAARMGAVDRVLRADPGEAGMRGERWDGKILSAWIARKYGIRLGVRQCQRLLYRFRRRSR